MADRTHADYLAAQLKAHRRLRLVPILAWSLGTVSGVFVFSLGLMVGRLS